jgi:hypothetical protein
MDVLRAAMSAAVDAAVIQDDAFARFPKEEREATIAAEGGTTARPRTHAAFSGSVFVTL